MIHKKFLLYKSFISLCRWSVCIVAVGFFAGCETEIAQIPPRFSLDARFDPDVQTYAFIIPNVAVPEGLAGIKASDCGVCHKTIYEEWQQSTHASSLRDIQFQSELTKPDSPKWICLNCHIPLQNQREKIVTALIEKDIFKPVTERNPHFDRKLQQEGVTCATCHLRTDAQTGKGYIIGPNGSAAAPHPVRKNAVHLRQICLRCHFPQGEGLTPNLICWFYTATENEATQPLLKQKFGREMGCVDCHMPEQQRRLAEDFANLPERPVNRHLWVGGGVPKWYEGYETLLARGYRPGLDVAVGDLTVAKGGRQFTMAVQLTNARAGHDLPTGDPERFLKAVFRLLDASGKTLQKDSLRIGQTWAWNPARKLGDNRLKFGETRTWVVQIPRALAEKAAKIDITVYHVKLSGETAQHIRSAENVDEDLFPNGTHFIRNLPRYYPMASYIFKEEIDLKGGARKVYSLKELVHLSQKEREKPLSAREY